MTRQPPVWTEDQLSAARQESEDHFAESRHTEPLELYLALFDEYWGIVGEFLEQTIDLTRLEEHALDLLSDARKREVFRYITGPPVSEDDLMVLVHTSTLAPARLKSNPDLVARLVQFARDWHDRRRFPWLGEGWEPDEANRNAAILATTALLAMRRVETLRRNEGKGIQERRVAEVLIQADLKEVPTRNVTTLNKAPGPGQFCRESMLGKRKADFIIGLWDGRVMAIECKVSNSGKNSIKRLNNDAAAKAEAWRSDFGTVQLVTAAVLGGVYKVSNLENAQQRGLFLFWAHDLPALTDFILGTNLDVILGTNYDSRPGLSTG